MKLEKKRDQHTMLKLLGYNLRNVHILPETHLSFVLPPKQGLNSNQNKGHLGSRYPVPSWGEFFGPTVRTGGFVVRKSRVNCLERSFPREKTKVLGKILGCCDTFMWTKKCKVFAIQWSTPVVLLTMSQFLYTSSRWWFQIVFIFTPI